jgi:thioredoxin-like negative regulator of GroEL
MNPIVIDNRWMIDKGVKGMNYPKKPLMLNNEKFAKTIERYPLVVIIAVPTMELTFGNPIPVIDTMAKKYQKKAVFGILNIKENNEIASRYDITTAPVFLIFKNHRLVSYLKNDVTRKDIEERIEQNL